MSSSRPSTPANGTPTASKVGSPVSRVATLARVRSETPTTSPFQLDVPKLHTLPSEQQALYLLTFTTNLAKHAESLSSDAISEEQGVLKKELLQIINLTQPAPTRVIRNNVGDCFTAIFSKGNRKLLYETINDLVALLSAGKEKAVDQRTKHAALSSLGAVFEAAGDSAISLSPLACTAILKLLKPVANETALRAAIYTAFARITMGINTPIDEELGRTIFKAARKTVESDRALLVQQAACQALEQLVRCTSYFDNSNDFEKLQSSLFKAMDTSCAPLRHAAASCLAAEFVKSFSQDPNKEIVPKVRKPKKTKKGAQPDEDADLPDRASSPIPDKPNTALSYSLAEILKILSTHYCRGGTTNRARAGIAVCYIKTLRSLGESVVETNYGIIALHLFNDILAHPGWSYTNKYRLLISRKFVRIILERTVGRMLGESAQLNACRFLLNDIIKDYPQAVKERAEPGKQVLSGAISALEALMDRLGAAVGSIADLCREGLLQVLQHTSFTVQIHASRALRTFVLAYPQQLLPTMTVCMNSVSRELNQLSGGRASMRRCLGYAHALAAVLSTSSQQPLYGSVDVYARVFQQATTLLKTSGSSDLRVSSCQLQVAWIMIGGLMSLGPNFVKIHLNQLMLLWKNALPRPMSRENVSQRNMLEVSYLAHVRECALGSIRAFLAFNQRLLTSDISKRLAVMLENTVAFLQSLPEKKTSEEPANRLSASLQLQDYDVMVRRRVFQCFCQLLTLSPLGALESTAHSTVLPLAVASFSDVDYYVPSSLSASIASAAANFESIWEAGDNYGFGVTGLISGLDVRNPVSRALQPHWSTRNDKETDSIDASVLSPVSSSAEMDGMSCYLHSTAESEDAELPNSSSTETVNAAIAVFGLCLPLQTVKVQESMCAQISSSLASSALQKDAARKSAITVNVALALLTASKVTTGETGAARGDIKHQKTEKALQSLLHLCLMDTDESARQLAASAIGRVCCSAGTAFTASEVTFLTETIVSNREPHVRAGCAVALARIHSQLGGMAAGFHMKSIVGILMSLTADTHPLVHFWALDSLAQVAESAGLNFSGYVTSTIGILSQLYVSESHNPETSSLASSNMSMSLPVTAAIARGLDAIVNVLGPDLQDMTKARELIMSLVILFSSERDDVSILLESLRCMEHLSLYAPGFVDFADYVCRLQANVDHENVEIRQSALHGLFTLMRRDADDVVKAAKPGLENRLWDYLNTSPDQMHIRSIFMNWLQQTGLSDPAGWIHRCNAILTKAKTKAADPQQANPTIYKDTAGPDLQDEEVAGFAAAAGVHKEEDGEAASSSSQELMRWQVRFFAMECLHTLISMISKEAAISSDEGPGERALQQKVGDVIRIAFSASTAGVPTLRVVGLRIIEQILEMFGRTPDPEFPEAMLLELYQAQISSALTPAFAADSSPELAAEAVNVCATFIATGIVTDVDRMGRILKLLVSALDSFSRDTEVASIGDLKGLSSNAQVMVRMAVFSAWAELQIASGEQKYLDDVVKPHIAQLVPLWLTSLREYSRLRFEPDISQALPSGMSSAEGDFNTIYAALNRQTLLTFYQDSWLSLVDAIASLIDEDSEFVFQALDDKQVKEIATDGEKSEREPGVNGIVRKGSGINYREEPVAFFFVLFGLAFESLAVRTADDDIVARQRNLDILRALKKILRPSVSGNAIYQQVIFAETMDLLDRMVLTESLSVQSVIVEIARNLCVIHPSSRQSDAVEEEASANGETLSEDIEQLFELTRIIVLVLAGLIPGLTDGPVHARLETSEEAVGLVRSALQALVDVSEVFPSIIKTDLNATILHIFVAILGTGACQAAVIPQALPIFRRFVASIASSEQPETQSQLRTTLARMQLILRNAQRRETPASVACEKNTLLAITVLLSVASSHLRDTDALVSRFVSELRDCLEVPLTSRIAAGCIRTLLLTTTGHAVAPRTLLSTSVEFLLKPSELEGLEESKGVMAQTLLLYAGRVPVAQRPAVVALAMKTLLSRATAQGSALYPETAGRLLELAALDNAAFRGVVAGMDGEEKAVLERVLKSTAGARRKSEDLGQESEPTIALKMNFGGGS
ncbi:armadillo-type protein [Neohortaea acidophila]|uniref:Armadillo-type protein n=1 Tax=Neohortaea acidophila TaxID=245834 RepID=A0A6A6PFX2_9PEZI|nr:armadillo-type protein [Neohortaea acidophila]KAF2478878.1 armadillo-type protein [Neohortaea acidophila]